MAKDGGFAIGDLLKWGLLLGGGYYVYRMVTGPTAAATTTGTTGSYSLDDLVAAIQAKLGTTTPPTATPTSAPPPPPASTRLTSDASATQQSKLLAAAGVPATQLFTVSQWNYYFEQVYGQNPGALGDDGSPMLIGGYLALLQGRGLGAVLIRVPMLVHVDGRPPVLAWAAQQSDDRRAPAARARSNYRRVG